MHTVPPVDPVCEQTLTLKKLFYSFIFDLVIFFYYLNQYWVMMKVHSNVIQCHTCLCYFKADLDLFLWTAQLLKESERNEPHPCLYGYINSIIYFHIH